MSAHPVEVHPLVAAAVDQAAAAAKQPTAHFVEKALIEALPEQLRIQVKQQLAATRKRAA